MARTNLVPNPALSVNSAGWSGLSGGRITNGHVSLPRQTAWSWSTPGTAGDILTPLCAVSPGASYRASFSLRPSGSQASGAKISVAWYNSSGSLLSSNPTSIALSSGTTARHETATVTAPSGAAQARVRLNDVEVGGQLTAVLLEQTSTAGLAYFDGDSSGAAWTGTAGASTSITQDTASGGGSDTWSFAESASVATSAVGPTGVDAWSFAEVAGTVVATPAEPNTDTWSWQDAGAIITSSYDTRRGRIRVRAFGLPLAALRVVVEARALTASAWTPVRGGKVAVTNGAMVRPVDDYEFPAGVPLVYRITALASVEGAADEVVAQAQVRRQADPTGVWLKFITAPQLNRRVIVSDYSEITRPARMARYPVAGRRAPVVVSDVHSGRELSVTLECRTPAERDELDLSLSQGLAFFLHTPLSHPLPSMYAVAGDYSHARPRSARTGRTALRTRWTVPLFEVEAPPPSVVPPTATWAEVKAAHATWAAVMATAPTWADLL